MHIRGNDLIRYCFRFTRWLVKVGSVTEHVLFLKLIDIWKLFIFLRITQK